MLLRSSRWRRWSVGWKVVFGPGVRAWTGRGCITWRFGTELRCRYLSSVFKQRLTAFEFEEIEWAVVLGSPLRTIKWSQSHSFISLHTHTSAQYFPLCDFEVECSVFVALISQRILQRLIQMLLWTMVLWRKCLTWMHLVVDDKKTIAIASFSVSTLQAFLHWYRQILRIGTDS